MSGYLQNQTRSEQQIMSTPITRRQMLQSSALAGAGLFLMPTGWSAAAVSANEKLNIAIIGIGGRGGANVNGVSSQNLVALCDVDDERAGDLHPLPFGAAAPSLKHCTTG